jgi:hypothetical protein
MPYGWPQFVVGFFDRASVRSAAALTAALVGIVFSVESLGGVCGIRFAVLPVPSRSHLVTGPRR